MIIPQKILKILNDERARLRRDQSGNDIEDETYLDKLQVDLMAPLLAKEARREAKAAAEAARQQSQIEAATARAAWFAHAATITAAYVSPLGRKIAAARKAAHITQNEVAQHLGVSVGMICHYETGTKPVPPERLEVIAALFQKPVAYFTGTTV